jgi:hypothetical protein
MNKISLELKCISIIPISTRRLSHVQCLHRIQRLDDVLSGRPTPVGIFSFKMPHLLWWADSAYNMASPDTLQKRSAGPLCACTRLPLCFNWSHGQNLKLVIMCASHPYYNKGAYNVCLPTKKI